MEANRVNNGNNNGGKHIIQQRHLECHATKSRLIIWISMQEIIMNSWNIVSISTQEIIINDWDIVWTSTQEIIING